MFLGSAGLLPILQILGFPTELHRQFGDTSRVGPIWRFAPRGFGRGFWKKLVGSKRTNPSIMDNPYSICARALPSRSTTGKSYSSFKAWHRKIETLRASCKEIDACDAHYVRKRARKMALGCGARQYLPKLSEEFIVQLERAVCHERRFVNMKTAMKTMVKICKEPYVIVRICS